MDDFFKNMKENLENRDELPYKDGAWEELRQNLNQRKQDSHKKTGIPWWLAVLVIFFLLTIGSIVLDLEFFKSLSAAFPVF